MVPGFLVLQSSSHYRQLTKYNCVLILQREDGMTICDMARER